jgi:hypothetical protein
VTAYEGSERGFLTAAHKFFQQLPVGEPGAITEHHPA